MSLFQRIKQFFSRKQPKAPVFRKTHYIQVYLNGKPTQCAVLGLRAFRLIVAIPTGSRVISSHQAVNQEEFAAIWKDLNGNNFYAWEDGTRLF